MYDIRQFKPCLYVLLIMGMTGFALAAQSPGVWVLSVGGLLLNAWLVKTGRFAPFPRWLANGITILALVYAFVVFRRGSAAPILVIGQFLVLLQLVKIFEQRGNRDYAQLLVLSLLLMVAAAINTASLAFGILFFAYLFLSLYCCLLFHLKVETDHAKAALGIPEEKLNPMTLRQDQRYLARSMRRLTVIVSTCSIAMAVLVFLFFPRNTGANLLGPFQMKTSQTLTGFSEKVGFQQVAQITQNAEIVAYVKAWEDEQPIRGTRPLVLRGLALDLYTGNDDSSTRWQWLRSPAADKDYDLQQYVEQNLVDRQNGGKGTIRQEVMLKPTGTGVLFAVAGPTDLRPLTFDGRRLLFRDRDQSLRIEPALEKDVRYEVFSSGKLPAAARDLPGAQRPATQPQGQSATSDDAPSLPGLTGRTTASTVVTGLTASVIDPMIEQFARRPEVSGTDPAGPLIARRPKDAYVTPLDEQIARNVEHHLKSGGDFSYTLDLRDADRIGDRDPIVAFLYDMKRGHCEYFAGAMTLLCQSLGLQARMVVGFYCDEYNNLTDSYVVRQAHAHAWVEVLNDKGEWITFDPTTGRQAATSRTVTAWSRVKQFFDYLEYTWANSVVAYDRETRTSLIQNVATKLEETKETGTSSFHSAKSWLADAFSDKTFWPFTSWLISVAIGVLLTAMVGAFAWFVYERWKLRRRAKRIGLEMLPHDAQLRMARQLGFYDDLLNLLARHQIVCPRNLTPLEFSDSITFLPNELYDEVKRLTEMFYRVRYGRIALTGPQQRHLRHVIAHVERGLHHLPRLRPSKSNGA